MFGRAELVVSDPANDIAILRPLKPLPTRTSIGFSAAPAQLGERVFTLGYPSPDTLGMSLKMTSGEVSAMAGNDAATGRRDDARFLQVSMPIHSGNSGGPVIDGQGRAVGIVISKMTKAGEDEIAQNVNYALKIGYVRNLLSELPAVSAAVAATPRATISGLVEELRGGRPGDRVERRGGGRTGVAGRLVAGQSAPDCAPIQPLLREMTSLTICPYCEPGRQASLSPHQER